jgi:hypothetical protein
VTENSSDSEARALEQEPGFLGVSKENGRIYPLGLISIHNGFGSHGSVRWRSELPMRSDWQELTSHGLDTNIGSDGHPLWKVFLRGADGVADPEKVSGLLDSNIDSVAAYKSRSVFHGGRDQYALVLSIDSPPQSPSRSEARHSRMKLCALRKSPRVS